ncbi:MAG: ferrochelatase [Pseudomonadota bacterium]|nr:ferrochelatase [Pseudomonadota bacterium]
MPRYVSDKALEPQAPARIGVLLVNLGTPDAPTAPAVRRYLAQFLSDTRVVEIPRAVWWPILQGIVLRVRPRRSAAKYATIWTQSGSPLLTHSMKQRSLVMGLLSERLKKMGHPPEIVVVELGMRYGNPSTEGALQALAEAGCDRVLVVPLYPQYAASATASALDAVFEASMRRRRIPALRTVSSFHDDPGYIRALAQSVNDYWMRHGRPDQLVLSFHGVPRRTVTLGDPYYVHCQTTTRLLAAELDLGEHQYVMSFQSRFGRAEWLQPYTQATVERLGREGKGRVHVLCPGFVSDCLETLEEIGMEVRDAFLAAGGKEFHAIPCLNEQPLWIAALTDIVLQNLQGWLPAPHNPRAVAGTIATADA